MAPLGQSGGEAFLESLSADEGAFLIEIVADRTVALSEENLLNRLRRPIAIYGVQKTIL